MKALPLEDLCRAACALARRAGRAILDIYAGDFSVQRKDDASPLTAADMAAHRLIVAGLQELGADLPVLSEESAAVPWAERERWERYWLVDPLDGTREFVKRNGEFSVNIALIDRQRPVLGVVLGPVRGELSYAWCGGGAFFDNGGGAPRAIRSCARPQGRLRVAGSRSHSDTRSAAMLERLGPHEMIALGSSLKFCLIARGGADFYLRCGPTSEWDTAAGQCILEQAGGIVSDLDGNALRYNTRASLINGDFLAAGDAGQPWPALLRST